MLGEYLLREFDIIIFGATGSTGRLASRYLTSRSHADLRIAIAGRNASKLVKLQSECDIPPGCLVVDVENQSAVDKVVEKGALIFSCAGPFVECGETVVAACAKLGRRYCDITAETPWIRKMIDRYQKEAVASGSCLVPSIGMDCIPADLTTMLAIEASRNQGIALDHLCLYVNFLPRWRFNGSTLLSMLAIANDCGGKWFFDADILIPEPNWPRRPVRHRGPYYDPVLGAWSCVSPFAAVNSAYVEFSQYLRKGSAKENLPAFSFEERLVAGKGFAGLALSYRDALDLGAFRFLCRSAEGRRFLRWLAPPRGSSRTLTERMLGFFQAKLVGREQGKAKLLVRFEGQGDPGNEFTIRVASEIAKQLLRSNLGAKSGFMTASTALGNELVDCMKSAEFFIDVATI